MQASLQRIDVLHCAQWWIHFENRVKPTKQFIGERNVMRGHFCGDGKAIRFCLTNQLHTLFCGEMQKVHASTREAN